MSNNRNDLIIKLDHKTWAYPGVTGSITK